MATSAQLGSLLGTQADLNYYIMQLNYWSGKYEANSEKLQKQVKYEEKWENAFEDAKDSDKKIDACGFKKEKGEVFSDQRADAYAHAKVKQYDEELSLDLAEKDIDYDTMKTMYEALVTQLQTQKESEKQSTATSAQDNHQLQS